MKRYSLLLVLLFSSVAIAAVYHFSIKANVTVQEANLSVSPESFSASISKGATYVKDITISNSGGEASIYFEYTVEGPDPESVSVSFHDIYGNAISSGNKLLVPAGSPQNPAEVTVNVHVKVEDDAVSGRVYGLHSGEGDIKTQLCVNASTDVDFEALQTRRFWASNDEGWMRGGSL